jgi:hypothetical protein
MSEDEANSKSSTGGYMFVAGGNDCTLVRTARVGGRVALRALTSIAGEEAKGEGKGERGTGHELASRSNGGSAIAAGLPQMEDDERERGAEDT